MDIKDRVLVIEDDKSIRNFFRTVLEANNYDVLIATTGAEGYSMVTSQCPDVVILDLGLPDMDGMTILKNVRQWSSMPVLVVSARTHEKDKVAALDAGADDYITKPFGTSELLGAGADSHPPCKSHCSDGRRHADRAVPGRRPADRL